MQLVEGGVFERVGGYDDAAGDVFGADFAAFEVTAGGVCDEFSGGSQYRRIGGFGEGVEFLVVEGAEVDGSLGFASGREDAEEAQAEAGFGVDFEVFGAEVDDGA